MRRRELKHTLLVHRYLYYVKADPVMSDYQYDQLEKAFTKAGGKLGVGSDLAASYSAAVKHDAEAILRFAHKLRADHAALERLVTVHDVAALSRGHSIRFREWMGTHWGGGDWYRIERITHRDDGRVDLDLTYRWRGVRGALEWSLRGPVEVLNAHVVPTVDLCRWRANVRGS